MTVGNRTVGCSLTNTCEGFHIWYRLGHRKITLTRRERTLSITSLVWVADELCASKHLLMDFQDSVPGTN